MIFALAAKELKQLFATPLAWVVLGVLQFILAWLFLGQMDAFVAMQPQFAELANPPGVTEAIVMPLFGSAAVLLMLATPLLAMRLIAGERHDRTFALLLSAPLSMTEIVLGKFFGLAAFLGVLAALPGAMALSLYAGGALDVGLLVANLFGLILLLMSFAALGLLMSSLTAHPATAAFAAFGALLGLWLISMTAQEPGSLLHFFSLLKHFEPYNRGLISSADAVFFLSFAALSLALTVRHLEMEQGGWTRRRALRHAMLLAALLGLAGVLAAFAQRYPMIWDISQNSRHSLSAASRNVLRQMPEPVAITAYAARQDIDLGDIRKLIYDFIEPYRLVKPDITLKFVDPAEQPQQARAAGIVANGELVVAYHKRREHVTTLNEQALTNALLRLSRNRQAQIRYLDGHGARRLDGGAPHDLGNFGKHLENRGIRPVAFDFKAATPGSAGLMLIAAPQSDLLPGEMEQIKTYLDRGGNLLWLLDAAPLHGLQPLAEALGLVLTPGTVIDPEARGRYKTPAVAQSAAYGHHAVTDNFDLITVFPLARQLGFNETSDWHVIRLVETSAKSWVENDTPDELATFDPQRDIPGPVTLAAALERTVADRAQRVAIVGGGDFLSNTYIGLGGNLDFGINLVEWLKGDDNLIAIQPKATVDATLNLTRTAAAAISLGFLFGLPLVFFAVGGVVWWRRRS
ncbi:MAG: Gldg family protein [Sulfuricellaceae bacterium]